MTMLPASRGATWRGDEDAQSTGAVSTTLQTRGKGKRGLPPTSGYLLSARDSCYCRVQGTCCKSVVQMLIKLIPAFMCLADKVGCWCSKFRLEKNNSDGVGPWLRG